MEVSLPGQPAEFHSDRIRGGPGQRGGPRPPVRAVNLGQHAPRGPFRQRLALTLTVGVVLGGSPRAHRYLVQDLQRGPLRSPDRVPVQQGSGFVRGPQRSGERREMTALPVVEGGILRDVLDPQIERADEPPAHRQVRGCAHRGHRLGGVQRVDQDEPGAQLTCAPGRQVSQVTEVTVPPGRTGTDRVELDGQTPGPALRDRRGQVGQVRAGRWQRHRRGIAESGEDRLDRFGRHRDLVARRRIVGRRHSPGLGGAHQFRRIHGSHRCRPGESSPHAGSASATIPWDVGSFCLLTGEEVHLRLVKQAGSIPVEVWK